MCVKETSNKKLAVRKQEFLTANFFVWNRIRKNSEKTTIMSCGGALVL